SLALMFLKGEGIAQNYVQALVWFHKAAEKGFVDAQYNLGTMYKKGQGVKLDYLQAVDWYQKAADQGDADAQFNLAIMYKNGQGVNRFYDKSAYWFRKAAEQGHGRAQTSLGVLYVLGNGVKQNFELAVHWYKKAVVQGQKSAQNNLGWLYEKGMGVAKDYDKALALYSLADNAWSKHRHANLSERINCLTTSKTRLFMTALKCADRDGLMAAIKEGGAKVKAEDKGNWGDIYLTSSKLFGTSELYVAYTSDDRFAMAKYTFGGKRDLTMVNKVKDIVSGSYGEPDSTKGKAEHGEVSYTWTLKDGITLEITRGWPDTTTAMTYLYPEHYQVMKKEQQEQDSAQGKRYRTQTKQF
ncbi:MAG: sel1 repeat family protein, partial [Algicola sp.]|nr:sel1 repeat family protein [Algicola sp.]